MSTNTPRLNPKKNPSARRRNRSSQVASSTVLKFSDLPSQTAAIRAHFYQLNIHEEQLGTKVVHSPVTALKSCINRYAKHYGLTSKYHANGQLRAA